MGRGAGHDPAGTWVQARRSANDEPTLRALVDGTGIEPVSSAQFSKMRGRGPRQKSNRPGVGCRPRPRTELVLLNREASSPGRLDGNALDPPQGFEP